MCLRLNREESIIAGPSAGLALAGLLKVVADQPDAVVVVMFADNIFKYASSIERHFPQFRAARAEGGWLVNKDGYRYLHGKPFITMWDLFEGALAEGAAAGTLAVQSVTTGCDAFGASTVAAAMR